MYHIGIDARLVNQEKPDGAGRYMLEILNHLNIPPGVQVTVFHTSNFPFADLRQPERFRLFLVRFRNGDPRQHLVLPLLVHHLGIQSYFYPFIDPPLLIRAPIRVFTVYDLNHFFFSPYAATERWYAILATKVFLQLALLCYTHTITISQHVARLIEKHTFAKAHTIDVQYPAFSPEPFLAAPDTQPVPAERYVLYVGNNRPHKNIKRLIESFKLVLHDDPTVKLVIAGTQFDRFPLPDGYARDLGIADAVVVEGTVSNSRLACLYQNATLFIYPSVSEGFGLPLLEAMYFGVPIVAAQTSCIPEIAADAARLFDPFAPTDMAAATTALLGNPELRQDYVQRGYRRLQDFSWQHTADQLLQVLLGPSGQPDR